MISNLSNSDSTIIQNQFLHCFNVLIGCWIARAARTSIVIDIDILLTVIQNRFLYCFSVIIVLVALASSLTSRLYLNRWYYNWTVDSVDLKDSSRPTNGIKSWTFSCVYFFQLSTWINSTRLRSTGTTTDLHEIRLGVKHDLGWIHHTIDKNWS